MHCLAEQTEHYKDPSFELGRICLPDSNRREAEPF